MTLEELYAKYDDLVGIGGLNVTPIDHFVFDLTDDNSQGSLKQAFPGIEALLMPEAGKYLVISTLVETPDCLALLFPERTDGSAGLWAFNVKTHKGCDLTCPSDVEGPKPTIDNFKDFANMEDVAKRFNEFAFMPSNGEDSCTTEVKDIGSFEVSNDEPVEVNNTNTDNEETEMKFKPIKEETELDSELKDTKWVEIPNTNAHGVTVTEDDAAADPFADAAADIAPDAGAGDAAAAPADGGEAAPADAGAEAAPAEGDAAAPAPAEGDAPAAAPAEGDAAAAEAPAEEAPADIEDPKAKMRELLAYYTNYMTELVQDPNTSTELISATQEMIDSLIKNMESADGIEEVKAETEEAAKAEVSADETPAEGEGGGEATAAPAEGGEEAAAAPAEGEQPVAENTDEQTALDAKIDGEIDDLHKDDIAPIEPIEGDDILTPGDIRNSAVNDVDLTGAAPTPDEELAATAPDLTSPAPTSDVLDDTPLPTPDEEVDLLGPSDDAMVGADGLPLDTFDGDLDALAASPVAKKVAWSNDYALNGIATSDDTSVVVPEVLKELSDYYKKVADEVSKVPGKEDVAMKLQKIQILSQTISNEWNSVLGQICDGNCCANSYDLSNMCDLEKDELASQDALGQIGADVMADDEKAEEDELAINNQIEAFCESFKHLI